VSPDSVDEWRDRHVQWRQQHHVVEQVLEQQDGAVCLEKMRNPSLRSVIPKCQSLQNVDVTNFPSLT
jgi:hypothetical protein